MPILVRQESHRSPDAIMLMEELCQTLAAITGDGGGSSFSPEDLDDPRAVFVVARDESGFPVGCGAIRPMDETTAEIKRMYARRQGGRVGSLVLAFLEEQARALGYMSLVLETRKVNKRAVGFYLAKGYRVIENYGRYRGREEAVCFGKRLSPRT